MARLSKLETICLTIAGHPKRSQRFVLIHSHRCMKEVYDPKKGSSGSYWFASGKYDHLWSDLCQRKIKHSKGGQRSYISSLVLTKNGWDIMNQARIKLGFDPISYITME